MVARSLTLRLGTCSRNRLFLHLSNLWFLQQSFQRPRDVRIFFRLLLNYREKECHCPLILYFFPEKTTKQLVRGLKFYHLSYCNPDAF